MIASFELDRNSNENKILTLANFGKWLIIKKMRRSLVKLYGLVKYVTKMVAWYFNMSEDLIS